jgi:nitrate reductase beta subunit
VQYLANMLSAGDTGPVLRALKRMMAMRHHKRSQTVEGVTDTRAIEEVGLTEAQVEEMYRYLAIANYEDRFVIPTSHREMARDAFPEKNGCGFTFGDGCHGSDTKFNLFNSSRIDAINITEVREHGRRVMQILKIIALLIEYPDETLWENRDEALSLIEQDAPMLLPFAQQHLSARCWINRPNGVRCLSAVARRRCCCSSMFTRVPRSRSGDGRPDGAV